MGISKVLNIHFGNYNILAIALILILTSCKDDCDVEGPTSLIAGKLKSMTFAADTTIYTNFYYDESGKLVRVEDSDSPGLEFRFSYPSTSLILVGWTNEVDFEVHVIGNQITKIIGVSPETSEGKVFDWEATFDLDGKVDTIKMPFDFEVLSQPFSESVSCGLLTEFVYDGNYQSSNYSFYISDPTPPAELVTFNNTFSYSTMPYRPEVPGQVPFDIFPDGGGDITTDFGLQSLFSHFLWPLRVAGYNFFCPNENLISQANETFYDYVLNEQGQVVEMTTDSRFGNWTNVFCYHE